MTVMKNTIVVLLMVATFGGSLMAQGREASHQKIESARIALITQRLDLSPEQAEKFWPIYHEYNKKRKALKVAFREKKRTLERADASAKENEALIEFGFETKQKQLDLEKEYSGRLQKVVSTKQLLALRTAEKDFRTLLLERVSKRRSQGRPEQRMPRKQLPRR